MASKEMMAITEMVAYTVISPFRPAIGFPRKDGRKMVVNTPLTAAPIAMPRPAPEYRKRADNIDVAAEG